MSDQQPAGYVFGAIEARVDLYVRDAFVQLTIREDNENERVDLADMTADDDVIYRTYAIIPANTAAADQETISAPETSDDPDLPVGTEITLHVTGRVVSARQGTLTLAVELPDGSAEDVTVDLTAAGVSTTIPSLTRLCGWPGCGRTYQAHHGSDAPGWTRISGLVVLCPDHCPSGEDAR